MNEPPLMPRQVCRRCGATSPPHATKCWLCEQRGAQNPYSAPALVAATASGGAQTQAQSRVQLVFLGLLTACVLLAVLIGLGLAVQDAGLLIPYLIVIAPAFLATGVRAALMVGRGDQRNAATLFFTFLWSGLFTALAIVLLVMASVIALFLWCVFMIASN